MWRLSSLWGIFQTSGTIADCRIYSMEYLMRPQQHLDSKTMVSNASCLSPNSVNTLSMALMVTKTNGADTRSPTIFFSRQSSRDAIKFKNRYPPVSDMTMEHPQFI
jgi:hypothetical protein